jgi:hypothetical protein
MRSASNSSSTNASPETITVSHNASRANPRSSSIACLSALCSRPRLLPFLFTAASSSFSIPIFRSGEVCRHFNFNSYSGMPNDAEKSFNQHQRIILVASAFDDQTLSAAAWMNDSGIDIACISLNPLKAGESLYLVVECSFRRIATKSFS